MDFTDLTPFSLNGCQRLTEIWQFIKKYYSCFLILLSTNQILYVISGILYYLVINS